MRRNQLIIAAQFAALAAAVPVILYASANGPDTGYSGAPAEQNCALCHSSITSGGGSVVVTFPNGYFYTPGTTQHWVLLITDASQLSWGFQLSARLGTNNGSSQGTQGGTFTPGGEGYTKVVCGDPGFKKETFLTPPSGGPCPSGETLQWIEHTGLGARLGQTRSGQFEFDWTPPSSASGPIDIYVSAVAGSGKDTTDLSHIYNAHYVLNVPVANQPSITAGGVVNGASFLPGVGPGSYVSIQGTNLANSTRAWGSSDLAGGTLPASLDGVAVTIGGATAYVEYVSPTQVNVLAPSNVPIGTNLPVQLLNNSLYSFPGTVTTQSLAPALFLWNGKYAVTTRTDFSYVAPTGLFPGVTTAPAKPGDTIILWASGLGVTAPQVTNGLLTPAGGIYNVLHVPTVTIGGNTATLIYAVLSPGFAGLYQIAVTVPNTVSSGDQSVYVQQGSYRSPDGVSLTIAAQ